MRILFFGDGAWSTNSLQRLVQEKWQLLGVVVRAKPSASTLLEAAESLGLPIFQPAKVNDPDFVTQVAALRPDLNLSVSYDQILRRPILNIAPKGFVNFHAGRLPYYRGRSVINWAIINGETEIGLTAHYMDEGIDTGDIVLQRTLPIGWTDTYGDVLHRVTAAFPDLVSDTVKLILASKVKRVRQSHLVGTYFHKRKAGDEWLDWSDTSRNLHNKVRAITRPGPGARTLLDGETVTIWQAFYDRSWPSYIGTPGQIVSHSSGQGVQVKTGDATLLVEKVQVKGGEVTTPTWPIGTRLGMSSRSHLLSLESRLETLERKES